LGSQATPSGRDARDGDSKQQLRSASKQPLSGRVQYVHDQIFEVNDQELHLLGGSHWKVLGLSFALPAEDIWIILTNDGGGVAFVDGEEAPVVHQSGPYTTAMGLYRRVVHKSDEGALLTLNDGSHWSVPEYDRFHTDWWLPPYPVLITSNGLYLINLRKGKRVWVAEVQ
jgi:hypothetical protein